MEDPIGDVGEGYWTVTINNLAPDLQPIANQSVVIGSAVDLNGVFSDPSLLDTFVVDIDWDDLTTDQLNLPAASTSFAASHTYAAEGSYTVVITLTDDDGGGDMVTLTVTVVPPGYTQFLPYISR